MIPADFFTHVGAVSERDKCFCTKNSRQHIYEILLTQVASAAQGRRPLFPSFRCTSTACSIVQRSAHCFVPRSWHGWVQRVKKQLFDHFTSSITMIKVDFLQAHNSQLREGYRYDDLQPEPDQQTSRQFCPVDREAEGRSSWPPLQDCRPCRIDYVSQPSPAKGICLLSCSGDSGLGEICKQIAAPFYEWNRTNLWYRFLGLLVVVTVVVTIGLTEVVEVSFCFSIILATSSSASVELASMYSNIS